MRESICLASLLLLLSVPVMAQTNPEAEVFGGYSLFSNGMLNLHGWNASVNGNINHWLGIKADFSGHYRTGSGLKVHLHVFTFGPQLSYRKNPRIVPFFHALFGGGRASAGFEDLAYAHNAFAMNIGGGLDWVAHKNCAVRVIQLDLLASGFGPDIATDARISAGIVFRLRPK